MIADLPADYKYEDNKIQYHFDRCYARRVASSRYSSPNKLNQGDAQIHDKYVVEAREASKIDINDVFETIVEQQLTVPMQLVRM